MSTNLQAKKQAVAAALSVADEVAKGVIHQAHLDVTAAEECQVLFGQVVGPTDPLWSLHVDVARQVLAAGGVPADELAEWLTVARATEPDVAPVRGASWIETVLADDEGIDDA